MPRKPINKKRNPTETDSNRVRQILDNLVGNEDPDSLMLDIIEVLDEGPKNPQVGRYYTFIYIPKTPNIQFDQNPLIAVTDVFNWGFKGINFHWNETRQYTWDEIPGGIYEVRSEELDDMRSIPYAHIRLNI